MERESMRARSSSGNDASERDILLGTNNSIQFIYTRKKEGQFGIELDRNLTTSRRRVDLRLFETSHASN